MGEKFIPEDAVKSPEVKPKNLVDANVEVLNNDMAQELHGATFGLTNFEYQNESGETKTYDAAEIFGVVDPSTGEITDFKSFSPAGDDEKSVIGIKVARVLDENIGLYNGYLVTETRVPEGLSDEASEAIKESVQKYNVANVTNRAGLEMVARTIEPVIGSGGKEYTPEEIMSIARGILDGDRELEDMTSSSGLRDKVENLLEREADPGYDIKHAESFPELYEAVTKIGSVIGSTGKEYSSAELIKRIRRVVEENEGLETITRTHDLKQKVLRLMKPKQ